MARPGERGCHGDKSSEERTRPQDPPAFAPRRQRTGPRRGLRASQAPPAEGAVTGVWGQWEEVDTRRALPSGAAEGGRESKAVRWPRPKEVPRR